MVKKLRVGSRAVVAAGIEHVAAVVGIGSIKHQQKSF